MIARNRHSASHPLITLTLSIVLFLVFDGIIFRSGLYDRFSDPNGAPNEVFFTSYVETRRAPSGRKEVFITGNSAINRGFSVRDFERQHPDAPVHLILGADAGTFEKTWYYQLLSVDPTHRKFAAIVIPTRGYKILADDSDRENDFENGQKLVPILKFDQWPGFLATYSDWKVRKKLLILLLFRSHGYAMDIQNFIFHPDNRLIRFRDHNIDVDRGLFNWDGSEGTLEGLEINLDQRRVERFPEHIDSFARRDIERLLQSRDPGELMRDEARSAEFRTRWLDRILGLYKDSPTKLIFVPVPRWPLPLPGLVPTPTAPDLRTLLPSQGNVIYLAESQFVELEEPVDFDDAHHLNKNGRQRFTRILGDDIIRTLEAH